MKESKEHILKVAFYLFLQKGFKEVTMKEIVEKTGLSKGAFYHYFKSKEQLFFEVNDYFLTILAEVHYKQFSQSSLRQFYKDYLDRISGMFQNMITSGILGSGNSTINYYTMVFDAFKMFPEFRARMIEHDREELEVWKEAVARARAGGEISTVMGDEQIAKVFLFTNDGIAIRLLMENRIDEIRGELMKLWDNFHDQIAAKVSPAPVQ
jgi:AcrR family transcriptional regulator